MPPTTHPLHRPRRRPRSAVRPGVQGNAIDAVAVAFDRLCKEGQPLAVDGAAVGFGLPARALPLVELRSLLLHPSTGRAARDAALTACLNQKLATNDGPVGPGGAGADGDCADWQLALLGLLLPGLRRAAGRLQREFPHAEVDDLAAELVCGVLGALPDFDPAPGRVAGRLLARGVVRARQVARTHPDARSRRRSGDHAAGRAARADRAACPSRVELGDAGPAHPDFVLAEAVRAEIVSASDAELIARTRLEAVPLRESAAQLGLLYPTARRRRARAERRLVPWLLRDPTADSPSPGAPRRVGAARSVPGGLSHSGGC